MKHAFDIKYIFAITILVIGIFVSASSFSLVYKTHTRVQYPKAYDIINTSENKVNFIAVGDIMLSRNVARHAEK
jgi:hypothetical protein